MTVLLCHCTCPDEDTATAIADALVAERLAACVSLQPGLASIYRWQGRVERAREVLLAIKTTRARLPALVERTARCTPMNCRRSSPSRRPAAWSPGCAGSSPRLRQRRSDALGYPRASLHRAASP